VIGLALQGGVVIHGDAALELEGGSHPSLGLLNQVPGLVGQVMLLAGSLVDVAALADSVGEGSQASRLGHLGAAGGQGP
jgi:hypothetical protein